MECGSDAKYLIMIIAVEGGGSGLDRFWQKDSGKYTDCEGYWPMR